MITSKRIGALLGALLALLIGVGASPAHADNHDEASPVGPLGDAIERGIDGLVNTAQNDCPPNAPQIQDPQPTMAGAFMAPPTVFPPPKITPDGLFAERGFGGLRTITYDLGCIRTPVDAAEHVQANLENDTSNRVAGLGFTFTALAHDLDSASWDIDWLFALMAGFAAEAMAEVQAGFVLPFIAAGLLFTTLVLAWRAHKGEIGPVTLSVVWALAVLAIGAAAVSSPLLAPRLAGQTAAGITQVVHQEAGNPAMVATDRVVEQVHYRGLERRYFGDQVSEVAKTNLPEIVEATSWSWEERARIAADPAQEEILWREKMLQLDSAMGMIQQHAPSDYADLAGVKRPRVDAAAIEASYAAASGLFRIMAAAVRIMCLLVLVVLAFLWVASMPYLVTPQGEQTGRALLGNTVRALGFLLKSILGSFGFGIFAYAAMDPAIPMGMSLVLLVLLTIIFWGLIRPDRALLSMMTFGKVQGGGRRGRMISRRWQRRLMRQMMLQHAVRSGTRKGMADAGHGPAERHEPHTRRPGPVPSEEYDHGFVMPEPERHTRWAPDAGLPRSGTIDGEVVSDTGWQPYRRPVAALPAEASPEPHRPDLPDDDVVYGEPSETYSRPIDEDVTQ